MVKHFTNLLNLQIGLLDQGLVKFLGYLKFVIF
jgi:hypothetical protein